MSIAGPDEVLGKGAGGPPQVQVWVDVYLQGVVQGAGILTVTAFVACVGLAWRKWRAWWQSRHHEAPRIKVVIVAAIYILPERDDDLALDAIPAHYSRPEPPRGDIQWAPSHGWEDMEELAGRRRNEAGENPGGHHELG